MSQPSGKEQPSAQEGGEIEIEVLVDGRPLGMAPFVRQIVAATVWGLLSTVKGAEGSHTVQIMVRRQQ